MSARAVATLSFIACLAAGAGFSAADSVPAGDAPQIVVSYFHGDVRCATCKKLEAYAREAVEGGLAEEVAAGRVMFRTVNVDRAENAHFIDDYQLVSKALIVTEERDGKVLRWRNLDQIWQLVRDQAAYTEYVIDGVRTHLGE